MKVLYVPPYKGARRLNSAPIGFSLVEILVVLGVIAIVAAILLPVFTRVRDRSRTFSCSANLRQIGQAMQLYVADSRGFYPSYNPPQKECSWADRFFPYVKSPQILKCPAFAAGEYRPGCTASEEINGVMHRWNGSYSLNTLEDGVAAAGYAQPCVHQVRVRFPSRIILVLDGNGSGYVNPGLYAQMTSVEELEQKNIPDRHSGGNNVLFADGHVKWLSLRSLLERKKWRASGSDPQAPSGATP